MTRAYDRNDKKPLRLMRWLALSAGIAAPLAWLGGSAVAEDFANRYGTRDSYDAPASYLKPGCLKPPGGEGMMPDDGMGNAGMGNAGMGADGMGQDVNVDDYSDYGTTNTTSLTLAPNMIGDFASNAIVFNEVIAPDYYIPASDVIGPSTVSVPIAAGDRRFKISENTSPLPRDRVYFNYNYFHNALYSANNNIVSLNRYTLGAEKTFLDGLGSVEVRTPFASGLSNVQTVNGINDDESTEFGNVTVIPKVVLASTERSLLAAGVGINLPTASDGVFQSLYTRTVFKNESVHLLPYLGLLVVPTNNSYLIGYAQVDFDLNGNTVSTVVSDPALVPRPAVEGTYYDPTLLHLDLAYGQWIYRNDGGRLSGIAPQVEIHYTTTLEDFEGVAGVRPLTTRLDVLTLTSGLNFQFYNASALTVGCAVPLRGDHSKPEEKQFDAEVQVMFNRWF